MNTISFQLLVESPRNELYHLLEGSGINYKIIDIYGTIGDRYDCRVAEVQVDSYTFEDHNDKYFKLTELLHAFQLEYVISNNLFIPNPNNGAK